MDATRWRTDDFDKEELNRLMEVYGEDAVISIIEGLSDDVYDGISLMLTQAINGGRDAIGQGFAEADLKKRRAEANMVVSEANMFDTISSQLTGAAASGPEAFATVAEGASQLVQALAEKNATMGEGNPHPGGTTVVPRPQPPEETPPTETPPTGTPKPPCYERYKQAISEHWRNSDKMDRITWWLRWSQLTTELVLCAGPEAAKLLIELIKAKK